MTCEVHCTGIVEDAANNPIGNVVYPLLKGVEKYWVGSVIAICYHITLELERAGNVAGVQGSHVCIS